MAIGGAPSSPDRPVRTTVLRRAPVPAHPSFAISLVAFPRFIAVRLSWRAPAERPSLLASSIA